jgi:DNA-binding MarR family transcriptional regulator
VTVLPTPPTRRPQAPGAQAWQLLFELSKASKPHIEAIAADFDLTPMQAWTMKLLVDDEPSTMSEVASALCCDASNVTGIIDRLESRGFVERTSAGHDRRVKVLKVTESGRAVHARLAARMEQAPPAIANLSLSDQRLLRDVLRRALDSLEPSGVLEAER